MTRNLDYFSYNVFGSTCKLVLRNVFSVKA